MDRVIQAFSATAFAIAMAGLMFYQGDHAVRVIVLSSLCLAALSQYMAQDPTPTPAIMSICTAYLAFATAIIGIIVFAVG